MGSVPSMNKMFAIMQKKRALLFYKNLSGYGIILYILYSSFNVFATRLFFIKRKVKEFTYLKTLNLSSFHAKNFHG